MATAFSLPQQAKIVTALQPRTTNVAISSTNVNYVSLKTALKAYLVILLTQAVGHATVITLRRGTGVGGMGAAPVGDAALATDCRIWANEDADASDALVAQTAAKAYTVTDDIKKKVVVFEIDPQSFDPTEAGYDVVGFTVGDSSQATNFIAATWVLTPLVYSSATPPTVESD